MPKVNFYRGNYEKYNKDTMSNAVFFATDKQLIIMNGKEYGGKNNFEIDGVTLIIN